jgi:hypothetical protein
MVMSHKNRKQIPLCRTCHIKVVHAGKYDKINLKDLVLTILYDNRTITLQPARIPTKPQIMIEKWLTEDIKF